MSTLGNPGWNDYLNTGLSLPRTAANAPTVKTYRGNIDQLAFTGTGAVINETWANVHILHDYEDGTKIYPHIHWSHNNASPSGDVKWILEYSVAKAHNGGVFPASTTISLIETAEAQYTHQTVEASDGDAIAAAELEPDSVVQFRVSVILQMKKILSKMMLFCYILIATLRQMVN